MILYFYEKKKIYQNKNNNNNNNRFSKIIKLINWKFWKNASYKYYYIYYILIRLRGKFILFIKDIFFRNKYRVADVSISLKPNEISINGLMEILS